jgi:hypothetical protein
MKETRMTNDLSKYLGGADLPALSDQQMADAMENATNDMGGSSDGTQFLSFSGKTNVYALGRNKDGIDPDQLYIMEPKSLVAGWVCWKGSKPVGRVEWSIYQPEKAVAKADLEDHGPYRADSGDGWSAMLGFGCVSADALLTQVKFSSTSKSGRNSISDLMDASRVRMLAKEPNIPAFVFLSEEFTAQEKLNYKPVLDVDRWLTRDAMNAFFAEEMDLDALLEGDQPKKKAGRRAAKKDEKSPRTRLKR